MACRAWESGLHIESAVALRSFAKPVVGRSIGVAWRAGSAREAEARVIAGVLKKLFAS